MALGLFNFIYRRLCMEKIECKSSVLDIIKQTFDLLFKGLDALIRAGLELEEDKSKPKKDGVNYFIVTTGGGNKFKLEVEEQDNKKVTLRAEAKGRKFEKKDVDPNKIMEAISPFVDDVFEESIEDIEDSKDSQAEDVEESKRINAKFKRICGSKEDSIELGYVRSDYSPEQTQQLLDMVVNNDEFIESLPEGDSCYQICDGEDDIDVCPCKVENVDPVIVILSDSMTLRDIVKYVHWNAVGEDFSALHLQADSVFDYVMDEIDFLGELRVELCGNIPFITGNVDTIDVPERMDIMTGMKVLKDCITRHVSLIETYYCSFEHDIQSKLDEFIRTYKSQANYFIDRVLK